MLNCIDAEHPKIDSASSCYRDNTCSFNCKCRPSLTRTDFASGYLPAGKLSMPLPSAMNVGAQSPTKIPRSSPEVSPSTPPCVIQITMLAITDKNPSAYERFAPNPSAFSLLNMISPN